MFVCMSVCVCVCVFCKDDVSFAGGCKSRLILKLDFITEDASTSTFNNLHVTQISIKFIRKYKFYRGRILEEFEWY